MITMEEKEYLSAMDAIQQGVDAEKAILAHIRKHYELYASTGYVRYRGTGANLLNPIIRDLFAPRREGGTLGYYVSFIGDVTLSPSIPLVRNVYQLQKVKDNLYQQIKAFDRTEVLRMTPIGGEDAYVLRGKIGSFLLFRDRDADIDALLSTVGGNK